MPEHSRDEVAKFLPKAIETALNSYKQFAEGEEPPATNTCKIKNFKDHHDACKVAIAHIKLLIELAKWADLPDPKLEDEDKQRLLQEVLSNANTELGRD